jgi:hypothetical protein
MIDGRGFSHALLRYQRASEVVLLLLDQSGSLSRAFWQLKTPGASRARKRRRTLGVGRVNGWAC